MQKTFRFTSMAALVVMGAILMGCAESDLATEAPQLKDNQIKTVTLTIGFDDSAQTRALTAAGVKTFKANDKLAVVYKNTSGKTVIAKSSPINASDISDDGKRAKFNVDLDTPDNSKQARLIYPAAMAQASINTNAEIDDDDATINFSKLAAQDGTIAKLGDNFDLCTYDGILGNIVLTDVNGTPKLTNRLAIGKFTIKNEDGGDMTSDVKQLTIIDGSNIYIADRTPAAGPIYVAMRPMSNKDLQLRAITSDTPYMKSVSGKSLAANTIYPINVKMDIDIDRCTPLTFEAKENDTSINFWNFDVKPVKCFTTTTPTSKLEDFQGNITNNSIIFLDAGDKITFYSNNTTSTEISGQCNITCDKECYVYGNIMSLTYGLDNSGENISTDFYTATTLPKDKIYYQLFYNKYNKPANDYKNYIITHPDHSLVLPAATLTENCYREMFKNCVKLSAVTCLATDFTANNCIQDWLNNVAEEGKLYKAPVMIGWIPGTNIPSGWTVETY